MGNDDGYDDHFDDDGFDDELDDDEEGAPKKKKRVATSTKIVLVVAAWLLLTLFLVGEFSKDKTPSADTASAQLDTVDGEAAGDEEELAFDEEVALEEFDSDGDGVLSDTERAAAVEAYEAAVASGEIAVGEPYKGVTGGAATATEEGAGEAATPGAGPTSGGAGSSSGSGTGAGGPGGGSGGSTSTTSTSSKAGGGGGSTTTTTTAKGPTSTTATSAPPTSSPPTTSGGGSPGTPVTVAVTAKDKAYAYPPGFSETIVVPRGSRISFKNEETASSDDFKHSFTISDDVWDSDIVSKNATLKESEPLPQGTFSYRCRVHDFMTGSLTVT